MVFSREVAGESLVFKCLVLSALYYGHRSPHLSFVELYAIGKSIGLRVSREKELNGADKWEQWIVLDVNPDILSGASCGTPSDKGMQGQELVMEEI